MKIAEIVYGFAGGGAPNVALSLSQELLLNNHTIHLIRVNIPYNNKKEEIIITDLENKGVKHFILNRKPTTIGFRSIFKLYKIFKKEQYDIVHSHLLIPDIYSAFVNLFLKNKFHHIITVHNTIPYHKYILLKTIFRNSTFVKCSKAIHDIGSIKREFVIENGINIEKFKPYNILQSNNRTSLQLDENCVLILSVGNLRRQKNQIIGIEMMNEIINIKKNENIHYLICGKGEEEKRLRDKVIELNLKNHVHFLGLRDDIPAILNESNFFINFSLWEGLPLAVIEAFASGITTILSPINEHFSISSEIFQCYIVKNNSPESYAATLESLIFNKTNLSHEDIFLKRETALNVYSSKFFANSYEKIFENILKK
jgi:glycosyltransferase involved in cell wall biosynthesis